MTSSKVQFSDIRYTPEFSAFQTRATIHEEGVAYVYPVHATAALTAEFGMIAHRLADKARKMHARRAKHTHMHHPSDAMAEAAKHPHAA